MTKTDWGHSFDFLGWRLTGKVSPLTVSVGTAPRMAATKTITTSLPCSTTLKRNPHENTGTASTSQIVSPQQMKMPRRQKISPP
jgi:tartrate dehydratase alpha subunit/fumarate hydratase class I-like protein